jgi:FHS family glucose/mannose:H+ symporter-like MFS transporter
MLSQTFKIKTALYINYFVFAILLNSVGIVILKAQENYGVDEVQASILELFKDLPIAIVSFLVASFLPRLGYKKAMLIGLGIVTFAALGMYAGNSFLSAKMLFLCVGAAFALIKVSVYATIGLVTSNESEHNSLMSNIEGFFMFGITFAYFLFPAFNTEGTANDWLNVYLLIVMCFVFCFFVDSRF